MKCAWTTLWVMILLASFSITALGPAQADTLVTLQGVTFADGGTASGYFELNVLGYMEAADIITTAGTSAGGQPLAGYTYLTAGAQTANNITPFDTGFYFNSTVNDFSLVVVTLNPVEPGVGFDPLVLGTGSLATLAGSYEYCTQNSINCGGAGYLDGRLITAGTLYAPEPATLGLLSVGALLLSMIRRRYGVNAGV